MSHLSIFALGPLRIELDGQPIQTSRHKALALLIYLALNRGRQSRASLSAFFWPEYSQEKAYAYLRRTLWEIRSLLGEGWLETDREEAGFHPDASIRIDVVEFQTHLEAFKQHQHPANTICPKCIPRLHTAILLYRGDFLSGFSLRDSVNFDDWHFFQQEALRREYAEALQQLATLFYQQALYAEAMSFARRWLALDTLNEEAHRLLMKIYVQNGQRHAALHQFQECQQILKSELGIDPEPATSRLQNAISSGNYDPQMELPTRSMGQVYEFIQADITASQPRQASLPPARHTNTNLPTPVTPFVGRQLESDHIKTLLSDPTCWLLTLLGPGGIGKTRLAIEAGRNLNNRFPQGVFFVSLSMVQNEQSITPAIASTMGMVFRPDGPGMGAQLFDFLREKHLLLILDSFEGLVPWSHFLAQLHANAPGIKLLVTSRRKLHQEGERIKQVAGLEYPDMGDEIMTGTSLENLGAYSAIDLFMQTAGRVQGSFQPTPADLAAICQIARLLEGMPLALELAATWTHTLPCQEIERRIRTGLDILESPIGGIVERQRSMRVVFNHSWEMLSSREQVILPRLAVFRGSFSRQAAQLIAGADLQMLTGLVDQSLVRRTAQGRYDMHDLLRQYCVDKLSLQPAENLEIHNRHCHYFTTRLAQWKVALGGMLQGQALGEMEAVLENLQAAWDWAVTQNDLNALEQGVDGLCMFYFRRARFAEGLESCQAVFDTIHNATSPSDPIQPARLSSRLRTWQAAFSLNLERWEEASRYLQDSRSILDDPKLDPPAAAQEHIFLLVIRGIFSNLRFDNAAMLVDYKRACALSQRANGVPPRCLIFYWRFLMGGGAVTQEIYNFLSENLPNVRQIGDPFELGCYLFTLGIGQLFHHFCQEKAEPLLEESIENFQKVADPSTQTMVIKTLGYLLLTQGKFKESLDLKQRELQIVQESGDRRMMGIVQAEIGEIYTHLGDYLRAEAHIRTGINLLQGRSSYEVALRHRYLGDVLLAQGKNEAARDAYRFSYQYFQEIHDFGWMLTALTGLSRAELALGNQANARHHARQALQLYNDMGLFTFFAYLTVAEMALLLAEQDEIVEALAVYSLAQRQGYLAQSRWFADLFGKIMETAARQVPEDARLAAQARGQNLDFSVTIARLLEK